MCVMKRKTYGAIKLTLLSADKQSTLNPRAHGNNGGGRKKGPFLERLGNMMMIQPRRLRQSNVREGDWKDIFLLTMFRLHTPQECL